MLSVKKMGSTRPWCASPNGPWQQGVVYTNAKPFAPASLTFRTSEQAKQAGLERTVLDASGSQANNYAKVAIDFSEKQPADPRVPESLSRAVKNTRTNCNNQRTAALSRKKGIRPVSRTLPKHLLGEERQISVREFALLTQSAICGKLIVYTVCFAARVRDAMARRIAAGALFFRPAGN